MQDTPEQTAIFKAGLETNTSLMINAYAGTGKTTTITKLATLLDAQGKGGGVALAFNTKIKQELERRFPKTFTVMTLNGLGHRAWGRAIGKSLRLEERKLGLLVTEALKPYSLPKETWDDVRRLVTGAMQKGLVPSEYPHKGLLSDTVGNWSNIADDLWIGANETTIQLARQVLIQNIKQAFDGVISFDDQIYCSAMLGGVFPRFALVLGDEAQDWSPLNHIQLAKTASDRIIAVGDPKQSLYAFRGADSSSMTNLRKLRKEWIDLPLATTFRCPKVIVARQQGHAPGFLAYHANPQGAVHNGSHYTIREGELEFGTRAKDSVEISWTWDDVKALGFEKVAILSRNNAQLISMAFKLLRQQIGVRMQGRDIGKGLIALSKKILPDDTTVAGECANAIEAWKNRECDLAYANSHEEKVAGITDRAESLMAVLESAMVENAGQLRKQLEFLFSKDTGQVLLSTIHRAKGMEWPLVIHLDPWRIPSKHARKAAAEGNPTPLDQDRNAVYVCETRAQEVLILANLQDFH